MIQIKQVVTRKEQKDFLHFPLKLYKDNPYFVPPLYGDEKQIFSKNYMYYDQAEAVYYNAYKDGKMVGRISGIWQKAANEKWGQKRARFTRFDCINDVEVAEKLFEAVENWAKSKNAEEIVGPLGFSDLEREGLLIEGFDQLSTFEEQYNYDYYQNLIESCGYSKDVDWTERKVIFLDDETAEYLSEMSAGILKKYGLKFVEAKNTRDFLKRYVDQIFNIWDETYGKIYGTVPFTDRVKKSMLANFKLVIDLRFIAAIVDKDDKIVAFGVLFPSMAKAVQKSGGRLTPACIIKLLRSIKKPRIVDMALIGVIDKYVNTGVAMALVSAFNGRLPDYGVEYAETNLILEENAHMQNLLKRFTTRQHKRRRCYIKNFK